jgi:hypothetical protein
MYIMLDVSSGHNKHYIHCNRVFRNDKQNVYTFMQFWLLQLEWYMYTFMQFWLLQLEWYMYIMLDIMWTRKIYIVGVWNIIRH